MAPSSGGERVPALPVGRCAPAGRLLGTANS